MRTRLMNISRYLAKVETKALVKNNARHAHKVIPEKRLTMLDDDEIYNHIMNQISFIHFPEFAYLKNNSKKIQNTVKSEAKEERYQVRMLRDIGH